MATPQQLDDLIAYAEGQLTPDRRAAFERALRESPELSRSLDLLRRADRSVVEQFAAPGFVPIDLDAARATAAAQRAQGVGPGSGGSVPAWRRWLVLGGAAIAASVLVAFVLFYAQQAVPRMLARPPTLVALYDREVESGFIPAWECRTDQEFIDTTRNAFGVPLLATSDSTVRLVGWSYADRFAGIGLSERSMGLLAKVGEKPVLVLLDKAPAEGKRPKLKIDPSAKDRLFIHQREVEGVLLYEVSPLPAPAVLDRFKLVNP